MGVPYAEVIGDPVAHSKSPTIHKFWLEKLCIEADYRAKRVTADELPAYLEDRRADPDWRGCNVTMPLKKLVWDRIGSDPITRRIGSLNTVIHYGEGGVMGANTDWIAFNLALDTHRLQPQRAVVIGTGGTARAAMAELQANKTPHVAVASRTEANAVRLLADFGLQGEFLPIDSAPCGDLLINASPMGMAGFPSLEIDLSNLSSDAIVVDMVYHPVETELLHRARARGLQTIDGVTMLMWQASMAFTYFFKESPAQLAFEELRRKLTS
jgi:shikimate dehydrogenase